MHEDMKYENHLQNTPVVSWFSFVIWDSVYTEVFLCNCLLLSEVKMTQRAKQS